MAERSGPPTVIHIEGCSLRLDLSDGLSRALWLTRRLPQSGAALRSLCRPGDVVLDVGANLGYMALVAARAVGPSGRVIAIEPAARSFELLRMNAEMNFPDRITPIRAACDEEDGTAKLVVSEDSEEYSSLSSALMPGKSHVETVPARSLRSLIEDLGVSPDVVKVDVEGAEWAVLKGLGLDRAPPRALLVEAYARNTRQFGYEPSEMCDWLRDRGYRLELATDAQRQTYTAGLANGAALHDVIATR
jgi:FkbM family methyltransferase